MRSNMDNDDYDDVDHMEETGYNYNNKQNEEEVTEQNLKDLASGGLLIPNTHNERKMKACNKCRLVLEDT